MPTYYLDYVNGDDANSGANFGLAKKTINGFTAAILAPGDIIHVAKSPDPTSLGQTATWNNISKTVTLTNPVTATVDMCESGWVAGSGVTRTYDTGVFKEGVTSLKLVTDASVTTARLLAYKTLASTDFSGYQQISLWFNNDASLAAGVLQVKLCSDTLGVTAVDTFDIPASALTTAHWAPLVINKGSALGGTIQSVAIYCTASYASKTNYFDCIIACYASTADDSLNLTSLISKYRDTSESSSSLDSESSSSSQTYVNTRENEGWYPIQSINGTTIKIDSGTSTIGSAGKGYYGTTENVITYKRETIKTTIVDGDASGYTFTLQDSGTAGNLIEWQGGYDTGTDVQDGETFFDGSTGSSAGILSPPKTYNKINLISFARYYNGIHLIAASTGTQISNCNCIGMANIGIYIVGSNGTILSGFINCNNNNQMGLYYSTTITSGTISASLNLNNMTTYGMYIYASISNLAFSGTVINCNNCTEGIHAESSISLLNFSSPTLNLNNCSSNGMYTSGMTNSTFSSAIYGNSSANLITLFGSSNTNTFNGAIYAVANTGPTVNVQASSSNIFNGNITSRGYIQIYNAANTTNTFNGNITIDGVGTSNHGIYIEASIRNVIFNGIINISNVAVNGIYMNSDIQKVIFTNDVTINTTGGAGVYLNSGGLNIRWEKDLNISNAGSYGFYIKDDWNDIFVKKLTINTAASYGLISSPTGYGNASQNIYVNSGSVTGISGGSVAIQNHYSKIYCSNFSITATTFAAGHTQWSDAQTYLSNCDVAPYVNKIFMYGGLIQSDSGTRHTASGISWKMSPTSGDRSATYPVKLSLARIAVLADLPVTVTAWFRRDNAGITGTLKCEGGQVAGVDDDVTISMSGIINTWEQLSITFNPTAQGVVEITALAYGGTSNNVWIDDMGVSQ